MARLGWQTDDQCAELAKTGFATYKALAEARGISPATLIDRVRKGVPLVEAADPKTKRPTLAKRKRKSEKLTQQQLSDITALGFESVRAMSLATDLTESCVYLRLRRGWSVEQAVNTPPRVTTPLPAERYAELRAFGFASIGEFARAAEISINQVWDRWVRKGWPLDRVFEEPIRACVAETKEFRASRESQELVNGRRKCVRCGTEHSLAAYRASACSSNGRWRVCATCVSFNLIADRYGLSRDEYMRLWKSQSGKCYGCRTDLSQPSCRVHVEHDHKTGEVRGLACAACNWTIGDFRDNPEYLRSAASWLRQHPRVPDAISGTPQRRPGDDVRAYTLWRDHCMTILDLADVLERQGGRCGICRTMEPASDGSWVVDHHHGERNALLATAGQQAEALDDGRVRSVADVLARRRSVRGVLCSACNKGVGHALEDQKRLLLLAEALTSWAARQR